MSRFSARFVPRAAANTVRARRAALVGLAALTLGLSACDDPQPWEQNGKEQPAQGSSAKPAPEPAPTPADPNLTDSPAPAEAPPPDPDADAPSADAPVTDDAAPTDAGSGASPDVRPDAGAQVELAALAKNVSRDRRAMLSVRTMVSAIEGCRSGRQSYLDCDTAQELGGASPLTKAIGTKPGKLKITATARGFRVTAFSRSGAKFTVARGPRGDRFSCTPGELPGACTPEARTWSW